MLFQKTKQISHVSLHDYQCVFQTNQPADEENNRLSIVVITSIHRLEVLAPKERRWHRRRTRVQITYSLKENDAFHLLIHGQFSGVFLGPFSRSSILGTLMRSRTETKQNKTKTSTKQPHILTKRRMKGANTQLHYLRI